ncbi:MAG: hypothetical protein KBA26_10365 [Candidatus Delongbacteria bacterium]|nr:hypothetical protein [Candidatus Delongbacteria bacterium]
MRKTASLLLMVLSSVMLCCSDDNQTVDYHFEVLGLQQLIVNEEVIALDSCGFPIDIEENQHVHFTGLTNQVTQGMHQYDLVVYSQLNEHSIQVKSRHENTRVEVVKEDNTTYPVYSVIVTRNGFDEKVIYRVCVMNLPIR